MQTVGGAAKSVDAVVSTHVAFKAHVASQSVLVNIIDKCLRNKPLPVFEMPAVGDVELLLHRVVGKAIVPQMIRTTGVERGVNQ